MVQPLWKTVWQFLKKLKVELSYDPAIPLPSIYPKELKARSGRDIYTPMFTAAFFTTTKTWKQHKYPLMDEWINKMWYIHILEYYWPLKKEGNFDICYNMGDL